MKKIAFIYIAAFAAIAILSPQAIAQPGFVSAKGLKLIDNTIPPFSINLVSPTTLAGNHTFILPTVSSGFWKSSAGGVMSITSVDLSTSDVSGLLSPSQIALPDNNILVGTGSGVGQAIAPGATNSILSINGSGDPTWQSLSSLGVLTGGGTATQVAFFAGTPGDASTTLASSSDLFWDNTEGSLGVGGSPDVSSALDISSTSKGMLAPRMTIAERNGITSPATGLLIYQTNSNPGFYYYNGAQWVSLVPSSGGIGSVLFRRKTAAQNITLNGILAVQTQTINDNDLVFTIAPNEAWEFEVVGYLSVSTNGLIGVGVGTASGVNLSAAADAAGFIHENLAVSVLGILGVGIEGARIQNSSAAGDHINTVVNVNITALGATVSNTYVKMKGFVRAGASATDVTVRWQQTLGIGIGSSTVLTIQPNTYLKATRVE